MEGIYGCDGQTTLFRKLKIIVPHCEQIQIQPDRAHLETVAIWQRIFSQLGLKRSDRIVDLCPGDDPKVQNALKRLGFDGTVMAVDASEERLQALARETGDAPFTLVPSITTLQELTVGRCEAIVANHPIDDIAVWFYAEKNRIGYDELYGRFRSDPNFSRETWRKIAEDEEVKERTITLFCEIARKNPSGYFIISQYPSKYERVNQMKEETAFCAEILRAILDRLCSTGEFTRKKENLPESEVHTAENWLVLERTSFRKIELRITDRCNLRCAHCCAFNHGAEDVLPAVVARLAEQASHHRIRVGITGGEPFLHQGLGEIIQTLANAGIPLSITTNGTVLREELVHSLANNGVRVKVSIHGNPEYHDRITGVSGAFQKTVRTIKRFVEAGINPAIQTNIHRGNYQDVGQRIELCSGLGVQHIKLFPLMDQGKAKLIEWSNARLEQGKFLEAAKRARIRAEEINWSGRIEIKHWDNTGHYVLILPSGEITVNPVDTPTGVLEIGNIIDGTLADAWEQYPFRRSHLQKYQSQ